MKTTVLVLLFALVSSFGQAQSNLLTVNIKEDAPLSAYVYRNQGSNLIPVDSIILGKKTFVFDTKKYEPGVYSFVLSEDSFFRFIVNNNEDVEVSTSLENVADSLRVISSNENKIYYKYLRLRKSYTQSLDAINTLLDNSDNLSKRFLRVLKKEKKSLSQMYSGGIRKMINAKGNYMVSQIILSELPVIAPETMGKEERQQYLIGNWWSSFPFDYENIVNTTDISDKLWEYFDLFYDDEASRDEQTEYFKRVIDEVLSQPAIAPKVYEFFRSEMLKTFTQSSFDALIKYIRDYYPPKAQNEDFEQRLDQIMRSSVGQKGGDFDIELDSTKTSLYKLDNNGTVLVFWSMNCSHCRQMMPDLKRSFATMQKEGIDLILINLDGYRPAWKLYAKQNQLPGYSINVQNPFTSPIMGQYNVEATPTIYVLDAQKQIVAKPTNMNELMKELGKMQK